VENQKKLFTDMRNFASSFLMRSNEILKANSLTSSVFRHRSPVLSEVEASSPKSDEYSLTGRIAYNQKTFWRSSCHKRYFDQIHNPFLRSEEVAKSKENLIGYKVSIENRQNIILFLY